MLKRKLLMVFWGCTFLFTPHLHAYGVPHSGAVYKLPDLVIFGKTDKKARRYSVHNGKRFITTPYGQSRAISLIAEKTREYGKTAKVSARQFKMPPDFIGRSLVKYEYTFASGHRFALFQADKFSALGYYTADGHLVLDVLNGGGAFAAPQLWGPYDQLIGKNYRSHMEMLMGNGKQDGMGTMKAAYSIGYTAVLPEEDFYKYGKLYTSAINSTVESLHIEKQLQVEQTVVKQSEIDSNNI